jgi:hypothetical protein
MKSAKAVVLSILTGIFWASQTAYSASALFDTAHFSGSGNCAACHDGLFDKDGNDVSIEDEWSATMMANSSRDPLWQAKFASELIRTPALAHELNEVCTRCHAPMANVEAAASLDEIHFFGDGFSDPAHPYHDAAMDGVSCTLCHQIADDGTLGTPEGSSGNFVVHTAASPFDRPAFGPYVSPRINPMQQFSGFTPQYAAHISDSAVCASCHDLATPVIDLEGDLPTLTGGKFHEQAVYTEWLHSAFADGEDEAQSCQHCHMARADGVKISNRPRMLEARNDFARHGFYGGNTLVLDILANNREALGVGEGDFAASVEATRETLRSAAEIGIEDMVLNGDELTVRVRVTNHTGHKLPTSFPSRRAYLHFTVTDQNGTVLFESGRLNPDGSIVGVDSDAGTGYEPHYNEITSADQVQVYEPIMADLNGNQTYTLLHAASYLKDNRIPPRGFDKALVPDAIAVVGEAAEDSDFGAGGDLVTYRVPLGAASGAISVSVALNYQTLAYGFLHDLRTDAADPAVARFLAMYEASPIRAETIATATTSGASDPIIDPAPPPAPADPSNPSNGPGRPGHGFGPGPIGF